MAINHETLVNDILVELSSRNIMVWKNATGVARALKNDQIIRYGLNGSSDILGVAPFIVTPDMVGKVFGRFVGVECKVDRDSQRPEQKNFQAAVEKRGGIYILARSVGDVKCL